MKTNVTISVDEAVLRRARDVARQQGASLNDILRRYLEVLAGRTGGENAAKELMRLYRTEGGHSGGRRIKRDSAYEGRS